MTRRRRENILQMKMHCKRTFVMHQSTEGTHKTHHGSENRTECLGKCGHERQLLNSIVIDIHNGM